MMMMSSLKLVLIFGAAFGLYKFNAQNTNHLASVVPQYNTNNTDQLTTPTSALQLDPGFDYFVFVLQWPAAFCNIQRNRQCNPDPVLAKHQNKFTVHGLWPQLNGSQSPLSCKTTQSMQDTDLDKFKDDLLEYWPRLFSAENFETSKSFWKHEWNKHGTCSSNKFNPQQYLQKTLGLAKEYAKPIFDELQKQGIKPDGTTVIICFLRLNCVSKTMGLHSWIVAKFTNLQLLKKEPLSPEVGRCSRVFIHKTIDSCMNTLVFLNLDVASYSEVLSV
ncbi:hypothetical protein K1719_019701 [Acacia pycnantha]|nr:hypothetical protein K1719_019701 [Acacia pycnantha]